MTINKYSWTLRHSISAIDHASFDGAKEKKRPWVEYPPIIVFKKLQSHFEKAYSIALLGKSIVHTVRVSYLELVISLCVDCH